MFQHFKKESVILAICTTIVGAIGGAFLSGWVSGLSSAYHQKKTIGYQISSTVILETDALPIKIKKIVVDDLLVKDLYSSTITIQNESYENLKNIDLCFGFEGESKNNFRIIGSSFSQFPPSSRKSFSSETDLQEGCDYKIKLKTLNTNEKLTFDFLINESRQLQFRTLSGETTNPSLQADLNEQQIKVTLFIMAFLSILVILTLYLIRQDSRLKFQKRINQTAYLLGIHGFSEEAKRLRNLETNISIASLSDELAEQCIKSGCSKRF
jgi:hypothetical protein